MILRLLNVVGLITLVLGQYSDNAERTVASEACFNHEEFPNPSECCTRPLWVNQYLLRPCRFVNTEQESYRTERETCNASCGVFKIIMMLINNRVQSVQLFKPKQLRTDGDPQWRLAISEAIKLCKTKITSMIGRYVEENMEMHQCELASDIFQDCLNSQLFLNCPSQSWIRNEGCDLAKGHLMNGCPYKSLADVIILDDNEDRNRYDDRHGHNDDFEPVDYTRQESGRSNDNRNMNNYGETSGHTTRR